jgi:SAM-dependent methyltransferase
VLYCPLCHSQQYTDIASVKSRLYYLCHDCSLIFTDPSDHLPPILEKSRYEKHQNSVNDQGYVNFLYSAINAARPFLAGGMKGLDYGCGPSPTLSVLLAKEGFSCDNYDPFFYPNLPKRRKYDYIFSTETFEHFRRPDKELATIDSICKPQGLLVVMTSFWQDLPSFKDWHYIHDSTHIIFFHQTTFDWICRQKGWEKVYQDQERITIMCTSACK